MDFVHCAVLVVTTLPCDGDFAVVGDFAVCAGEHVQLVFLLAGFYVADALVWCGCSSVACWHVCAGWWCWRGRCSWSSLRNW